MDIIATKGRAASIERLDKRKRRKTRREKETRRK